MHTDLCGRCVQLPFRSANIGAPLSELSLGRTKRAPMLRSLDRFHSKYLNFGW
jgi:hypothetical protein